MIKIRFDNYFCSAAGRYQINHLDWEKIQQSLSLPNFQPIYQDQAVLWLIDLKYKALSFVDNLNYTKFCEICSWWWESLPPGRYDVKAKTYKQIRQTFKKLCGVYGLDV